MVDAVLTLTVRLLCITSPGALQIEMSNFPLDNCPPVSRTTWGTTSDWPVRCSASKSCLGRYPGHSRKGLDSIKPLEEQIFDRLSLGELEDGAGMLPSWNHQRLYSELSMARGF
jgi:hypothetical protein